MKPSTPPEIGRALPFSQYDGRGYRTVSVEEGYRDWSKTYAGFPRCFDLDLFDRSALLAARLRGDHKRGSPTHVDSPTRGDGACFADLGCGTGRIGGYLKEAGARVVRGVDRCPEMLQEATRRGCYEALLLADMTSTGLEGGAHDGVITSMALCHVADLDAFYREARRLLRGSEAASAGQSARGEGLLAIVDFHPFFLLRGIPTHFEHPSSGEPIAIVNHVHSLSDHFSAGRRAGFTLQEFEERFVDDAWTATMPNYTKYLGWPITFLLVLETT